MPPGARKVSAARDSQPATGQPPIGQRQTDDQHASPDADPGPTGRLQPGDPAPEFVLLDADGATVALSQLRGQRVILYFYPAASTPGCTTEAGDFEANLATLQGAGVAVLGVSPDEPAALARFRDAQHLTFPLLSDPTHAVLQAYGAWGHKTMYGRTSLGVIRSTFVIDGRGDVEQAMYGVRASGHVARVLASLQLG